MIDTARLAANAAKIGLELTDAQLAALDAYAEAVVEQNKVMNLTAITDPDGVEYKHLLDSLLCAACPEVRGRVVDVGTGAGFPGVVLKIARPECALALVDATAKKLAFIERACGERGIKVTTLHGRAEELTHRPEYREAFDCATARAVANLAALCEYCLPFVKTGGYLIAMKGPEAEAELEAARVPLAVLGGELTRVDRHTLPDGSVRTLIILKKISQTPPKYPRSGKNITKNPIRNV